MTDKPGEVQQVCRLYSEINPGVGGAGEFKLDYYLWSFQPDPGCKFSYKKERSTLHAISKKVDVVRSLNRTYDLDLRKRLSEERLADEFICILTEIFLYCGYWERDFKLLNSALKICDGILDNAREIDGMGEIRKLIPDVIASV